MLAVSAPSRLSQKPKFLCVTNIPTPYRLHFFERLSEELGHRGWDFEVIFMAHSEPGRYWRFSDSDFKFRHRFLPGFAPRLGRGVLHCNPQILKVLGERTPQIVMMAGAWFLPTNLVAAIRSKFWRKTRVLFWSESHMGSRIHKGPVANLVRKCLLKLHDGFVVPGAMAAEYISSYVPAGKFYSLPNTVDHRVFRDSVQALRAERHHIRDEMKIPPDARLLIIPARLRPEKGLLPFLTSIAGAESSRPWTLLIAGDGPLRRQLEDWCTSHPEHDTRVLGQVSESEMIRLYAAADVFVLPSIRDPNPLSVIEALWAELPVLLSTSVGNHCETLVAGENGWLFDPNDATSTRRAFMEMMSATQEQLRIYAANSGCKARSFETETVVSRFLDHVLPNG